MASTTADAVFSSPTLASSPTGAGTGSGEGEDEGAAAGGAAGAIFGGPWGAAGGAAAGGFLGNRTPGAEGISGLGAKGDKARFDKDPIVMAQREQDKRFEDALAKAKEHEVTTTESGTQSTTGTSSGVSEKTFAPRSAQEQALLDASINNYQQQQSLVASQEAGIKARGGVQDAARGSLQSILGGGAFDLSPGEQARIDRLRQSNIDIGSNAVNDLLTQRLGEVSADAARRGLRGQAFTQLQGDALGEAAKSLERQTLDANRIASEQAIALPGQRVGIQAGTAGQFADFGDQLTQQAIQNRQSLQDPVALQKMLDERLAGGKTTTSETTGSTTSSSGTSATKGQGYTDILAAKAGAPGQTGAQVGAAGKIFGGIMGASG